jgi:hypothetical protein
MKKHLSNILNRLLFVIIILSLTVPLGLSSKTNNSQTMIFIEKQNALSSFSTEINDPPPPGCINIDYTPPSFDQLDIRYLEYQPPVPHSYNLNIAAMIDELDTPMVLGYIENLTAFGPRVTATSACDEAGKYLYQEFTQMGLDARYHNWSENSLYGSNIEATLPGRDTSSDQIYIICGHYDSVPGSPGADDNGAGTAAVLSAAQVMSQYHSKHTVRFVTFSGEEQGLFGSYFYVQEAAENNDNITATLNADMMGYAETEDDAKKVKVYDDEGPSIWITNYTTSISQQYKDSIDLQVIPSGYSWSSDHSRFWQAGYNAIFYFEYKFNPYYHSPQDTIENMNPEYATKVSKLIMATLASLAEPYPSNPPEAPTITGPTSGKTGEPYEYTFVTTDPDNDHVYYYIEWGRDCPVEEWVGPYASGEEVTLPNTYADPGTYIIRAKAKDDFDAESDWGTLEVSMPKTKPTNLIAFILQRLQTLRPSLKILFYHNNILKFLN